MVDVAGDASLQMNIQELGTMAHYQLPVKVVILNNTYLGMVRQWQELSTGTAIPNASSPSRPTS